MGRGLRLGWVWFVLGAVGGFYRASFGVWGGGCGVGWASRVGFVMGVRGGFIG